MIVPKAPQLIRMVQYVGKPLLALVLYDLAVVVAYKQLHWTWIGSPHVPLGLYGSAIGIIVGFRNNSSYARWWEARTLWGRIINGSRSLARQVTSTLRTRDANDSAALTEVQRRIVHHEIAYAHALRQQLRRLSPWEELERILPAQDVDSLREQQNISLALLQQISGMVKECQDRGWIDSVGWKALDQNISSMSDAQGGCERIKSTPLPKQYDYFPQLFVYMYCVLLPMGMVANLGWFTSVGSTFVGFMFLALDKIGRDLEDPFENTIFDVPMTSMTWTIEINLRQMLGERDLPEPLKPERGVLW